MATITKKHPRQHTKRTARNLETITTLAVEAVNNPAALQALGKAALAQARYAKAQIEYWQSVLDQTKSLLLPVLESQGGKITDDYGGFWLIAQTTRVWADSTQLYALAGSNPRKYGWLLKDGLVQKRETQPYISVK